MVQIIGELDSSKVVDDTLAQEFLIPAFSERMAKRRALANTRAKGLENASVEEIKTESSGGIPGQSIFRVRVESPR